MDSPGEGLRAMSRSTAGWIVLATKLIVLSLLGLLLLFGISLVALDSGACDDGGISIDSPPGWEVSIDYENDCQWTLFNAAGERAPDELYDTVSIDAPSPRLLDQTTTGYILIAMSLGAMLAVVLLGPAREGTIKA
ncbi:MAG: hypothetical protein ACR2N9_02535 [Acidimicrobiia bacterium]